MIDHFSPRPGQQLSDFFQCLVCNPSCLRIIQSQNVNESQNHTLLFCKKTHTVKYVWFGRNPGSRRSFPAKVHDLLEDQQTVVVMTLRKAVIGCLDGLLRHRFSFKFIAQQIPGQGVGIVLALQNLLVETSEGIQFSPSFVLSTVDLPDIRQAASGRADR